MYKDPHETNNLASSEDHQDILDEYKAKLKQMQKEMDDPWIMKWKYE
jgi:N-sulfoglucosamine sulfohydrolase